MRRGTFITAGLVLGAVAIGLTQAPPSPQQATPQEQAAATVQMQPTPPPEMASRVRFVGNVSFSADELRAALADSLQQIRIQGLSLPLADDAAYYLSVFYRRNGYPAVDVKYKVYGGGQYLELDIREGRYYNLGNIYFKGDKTFPPSELTNYMVGTTRARFSEFRKQLPYVEADLVTGTGLLEGYYVSQGFPKVQIVKMATTPDEARDAVDVVVTINEGPRYFFGPITFTNNPEVPMTLFYGKIKDRTDQPKPYSEGELSNLQRDLTFVYKQAGHYEATVVVTPDFAHVQSGGRVPIHVSSVPGPVYRFGDIVVRQGPKARLKPDFLPRRFSELQGQTSNPDTLRKLDDAMIKTGLFDTLDIQETAEPDDTVRLTLVPHEARQKEFSVFGGYQTYWGPLVGASYRDLDIDGEGHIFSVTAEMTGRGPSGEIAYEDPWFMNTPNRLRLAVGIDSKQLQGFTYTNEYGRISLTRKWQTIFESSAYVEYRNTSLSGLSIEPPFLTGPTRYQLLEVGVSQTIDHRDSPLNPTKGWILVLTAAGCEPLQGITTGFLRLTERFTYMIPIGKSVLAGGVRFGVITPSSGGTFDIPITERFFSGGADTVRSFVERDLGPHDANNNPIGGLARSVFNVEYDFPIVADLVGATFFDAGGLGSSPFDNMSTAIGAGLRYNLPIGPLRVDYGINPNPRYRPLSRTRDDFGAFQLSFGFAF
ncbi:MAG: BamA/TamA family outer membrane protein [Verrucomicrobia bacterium]|nr:BamA/TamA family outer membrane protein [Verrucomicrobiota bacterium]